MRRAIYGLPGFSAALGLAALCVSPSNVDAGGFASARFGGEHGHPTADHVTAIYYNPAGIALGSGTRIFAEGLLIYRNATYERPEGAIHNVEDGVTGTPTEAVSANAGTAKVSNIIASPFLGVVSDFGVDNLGVGIALYAPFGGQASWDKNDAYKDDADYPGAVDGVQRWATMDGSIKAVYVSAGVAYRLPGPRLSFGATASLVQQSLNTLRARTAAGNDDLVTSNGSLVEGRSQVDVSNMSIAAGFGVMWEASDDLRFGLSYQSQPGFGETDLEGDLNLKFGNNASTTTKINFTQALPDIVRFGMTLKPSSKMELRFAADFTRWSVFDKQCFTDASNADANCDLGPRGGSTAATTAVIANIQRNWRDTFGVRGGASYWLDDDKEIAGGVTYDSNAVPNSTIDPALIDMNKIVGTIGGRFRLVDSLLLNVSYTHVYYLTRDIRVRGRDGAGEDIGFDPPSATPDMSGVYKQQIGLVNMGVEYQF